MDRISAPVHLPPIVPSGEPETINRKPVRDGDSGASTFPGEAAGLNAPGSKSKRKQFLAHFTRLGKGNGASKKESKTRSKTASKTASKTELVNSQPLDPSHETENNARKPVSGGDSADTMEPDVPAGMYASGADRLRDKLGSFLTRHKKTGDGNSATPKRLNKGKRNDPGPSARKTETPEGNGGQNETRTPIEVPNIPYVSYEESRARLDARNPEHAPITSANFATGTGATFSSTKDPAQTVVRDSREETPLVSPIERSPSAPSVRRVARPVVMEGSAVHSYQQRTRRGDSGYFAAITEEKDDDDRPDISRDDREDLYSAGPERRGAPTGRPFGVREPEREPETLRDDRWQRHDPVNSNGSIAGGIDSPDEPRTDSQNEENFKKLFQALSPDEQQHFKQWADQETKIDPTRPVGPNFNPWARNNPGGGGPNNPGGGGSNPGGDDFLGQMRASQNQNMQQEFEMQRLNMIQQQFSTIMGMTVQQCSTSCNAVLEGSNDAEQLEETGDRNAAKLAGG